MAEQFNWKLAMVVLALAIVGYSFVSTPTGFGATAEPTFGVPANQWCIDADGQNNRVAGSCEDSTGATATDSCADFNTVSESFCSVSNICTKKYINCQASETCVNGACVNV